MGGRAGRRKLRINRWVALAFGAFVAGGIALVPMLAGAAGLGSINAPTSATAGTFTINVSFDPGKSAYSVDIAIPSGWQSTSWTVSGCGSPAQDTTVAGHMRATGNCGNNGNNVVFALTATVQTAGSYTFTATSAANQTYSNMQAIASVSITINPAAASKLVFNPTSYSGGPNAVWSTQPQVTVQDQFGNTVNSTGSITLAASPAGSGFTCTQNPKNAVAGVATFAGCKATTAGTYALTATSGALTSSPNNASFTITAGPPNAVSWSQQPAFVRANQNFSPAPAVLVKDASNNPVPNQTVSMSLVNNPGGASLTCPDATTNASGIATFSTCSLNKGGTGYTLKATAGSANSTSDPFDVSAQLTTATPTSTYFRCTSGTPGSAGSTGVFGANVVFNVSGAPVGSTITVTLGSGANQQTISTSSTGSPTQLTFAKGTVVGPCPATTTSGGSFPFSVVAKSGSNEVGYQNTTGYPVTKIDV